MRERANPDGASNVETRRFSAVSVVFGDWFILLAGFLPDACRYEPKAYLLGKEYFLHAYGPIYALSADVVNIINSIPDGRCGQSFAGT